MSVPTLENWRLDHGTIVGTVRGSVRHADDQTIRTSAVRGGVGRLVITESGRYLLGKPHADHVAAVNSYASHPDAAQCGILPYDDRDPMAFWRDYGAFLAKDKAKLASRTRT